MRYNNSVDALRQLLEFSEEETNRKYASEENIVSSSSASCSITQAYRGYLLFSKWSGLLLCRSNL